MSNYRVIVTWVRCLGRSYYMFMPPKRLNIQCLLSHSIIRSCKLEFWLTKTPQKNSNFGHGKGQNRMISLPINTTYPQLCNYLEDITCRL